MAGALGDTPGQQHCPSSGSWHTGAAGIGSALLSAAPSVTLSMQLGSSRALLRASFPSFSLLSVESANMFVSLLSMERHSTWLDSSHSSRTLLQMEPFKGNLLKETFPAWDHPAGPALLLQEHLPAPSWALALDGASLYLHLPVCSFNRMEMENARGWKVPQYFREDRAGRRGVKEQNMESTWRQ